jgi:hypothetical protein
LRLRETEVAVLRFALLRAVFPTWVVVDERGRPSLHELRLFFWFFGVVDYVYYAASDVED